MTVGIGQLTGDASRADHSSSFSRSFQSTVHQVDINAAVASPRRQRLGLGDGLQQRQE